jgi:hypothetical protein
MTGGESAPAMNKPLFLSTIRPYNHITIYPPHF